MSMLAKQDTLHGKNCAQGLQAPLCSRMVSTIGNLWFVVDKEYLSGPKLDRSGLGLRTFPEDPSKRPLVLPEGLGDVSANRLLKVHQHVRQSGRTPTHANLPDTFQMDKKRGVLCTAGL